MKRFSRPLVLIFLGILSILLLLRLGQVDVSLETLRQINLWYFGLALAVHYSGFLMRGWRWQSLLAGVGHRLGYVYTTSLLMAGWFVSALVPARAGDVGRAYMLHRDHEISFAKGFASLAMERAFDILAILFLTLIASTFALANRTPSWVWQSLAGGSLVFVIAIAFLFAVPKLEAWFLHLFSWNLYQKLVRFGFDLLGSVRQVGKSPQILLMVSGQSLYIWLCDVFLMHFALYSLGYAAPLSVSAVSSMVADLAAAVPLVPGAVGQFEGAALLMFGLFAISPQTGSLALVINRLISFWTFIIISGLVTYGFGFSQVLQIDRIRQTQEKQSSVAD